MLAVALAITRLHRESIKVIWSEDFVCYDLTSPLKLVKTKFQLSALTGRDSASNTMLECFDFSASAVTSRHHYGEYQAGFQRHGQPIKPAHRLMP